MAFDWRLFLIVAHELSNDTREAVHRTCLSRTYYYIYHLILIKAQALRFSETPPNLHSKLWSWCEHHSDQDIRKLGLYGNRLYSFRISADYKSGGIPNIAGEVRMQLERAQMLEGIVARLNGQQPPPALS